MKTKIAITIENEMLSEIDRMAKENDLNRSQFIENLISVGVSDAQVLEAVGFLDLARLVRRVKNKFNKRISKSRIKDGK